VNGLDCYAGELARLHDCDVESWWLARAIRESRFPELSPLTGTEYGTLIGVDGSGQLRISIQPGPHVDESTFEEILTAAGPTGRDAARALNRFGVGSGPRRGGWQLAVGACLNGRNQDFRAYIGTLDPACSPQFCRDLATTGWWRAITDARTVDLIDRARAMGMIVGAARRYDLGRDQADEDRCGQMIYFSVERAPTAEVLEYLCEPLDRAGAVHLAAFAAEAGSPHLRFGWAIAIGGDEVFRYLKLEIGVTTRPNSLDPAIVLARNCRLSPIPRMISCRFPAAATPVTTYWSLTAGAGEGFVDFGTARAPMNAKLISVRSPRPASPIGPQAISAAIARGARAVAASQLSDGTWRGFDIPGMGESDAWVTAHVGLGLSRVLTDFSPLHRAADFLRRVGRPGWGYNKSSPVDADSTAHACLFLQSIHAPVPVEALDLLHGFRRDDGGFATFQTRPGLSPDNTWCRSHPDVTPVAYRALANSFPAQPTTMVERMQGDRLPDGTWPAFWWNLRWYTACQWARACQALNIAFASFDLERADFACDLDAGYLLELAVLTGQRDQAARIAGHLAACQLSNGFWTCDPVLRLTYPGLERPWEVDDGGPLFADANGSYSTTAIIASLSLYESVYTGERTQV
jgi:hypothetical protein